MYFSTLVNPSVASILTSMFIVSKPSCDISKSALVASFNSFCAFSILSCVLPYSPVFSLTASISVLIVSSAFIISKPPEAPCLPNTSFSTAPTACEFGFSSFNAPDMRWITSNISALPVARSCRTFCDDTPMASRLFAVSFDISRNRFPAICTSAMPCSLNMPERVCAINATSCSALNPISWNAGAYCFNWLR